MKKNIKVLIVDDDPSMCETLEDILEIEGYETETALDGKKALEVVEKKNFDVILMDFKMPEMNGVEAFRSIKKIRQDAKVLFVTAYYNEDEVRNAMSNCAMGICHKPLDIEQFIKDLKVVVSGNKCISSKHIH